LLDRSETLGRVGVFFWFLKIVTTPEFSTTKSGSFSPIGFFMASLSFGLGCLSGATSFGQRLRSFFVLRPAENLLGLVGAA
jgi:hypothetical protein